MGYSTKMIISSTRNCCIKVFASHACIEFRKLAIAKP